MKKWLDNNINKVITIFLILQPVLDLLTGICVNTFKLNITIGLIVRMIFLALMCIITLFVYKKKELLIPYGLIIVYFILYTLGMIIYKDSSLIIELKNLGRVFYFPILLITLFTIKDKIRISAMTLLTVAFLYLIFLFVPTLFGLGYQSYKITKAGTLGFFNSANELSGIISILTPFIIIVFYESKKVLPIIISSVIYLVVILMIGTKTPLLALIIILGLSLLFIWNKWLKQKHYKWFITTIGIIIVGVLSLWIILPKTNFYKNIKTHLDYLGLNTIIDVFKDPFYIDHFVFSSRLEFLSNKSSIYHDANLYEKLFGIGYINNEKETKLIEMDYYDIYYSHGVVGFILFFSIIIYVLRSVLNDQNNETYEYLMKFTSLFLIVFLSFFTGHILTAPSVSILVVIIVLSIAKREKKDLLFASHSLDIGGIEKALLNLVNRIDPSKYNVTIILEEKRGIFLSEIHNNVVVRELKVDNRKNVIIRKLVNATRKLVFSIFNYNNYDFSACYATYSYSCNILARIASDNNYLYVHSNYGNVYKNEKDFREFFDTRNIYDFKKLIFVSKEGEESFLKVYPDFIGKTLVFNNYVNVNEIKTNSEEKIDEKRDSNKKLFVFVGRLEEDSKKLTRAINLVDNIPSIEMWIIGDGPDKDNYLDLVRKRSLEKRIKLLGKKTNPFPYMKKADYIILTSDYEGFPVTYLEALVLNKNIITTIPTSDDFLKMEDYAFIISRDENKMIKEVEKILKNGKDCKKIDLEEIQEKRDEKLTILFNEN